MGICLVRDGLHDFRDSIRGRGIGLVIAIGRVPPERSEAHNKTLLVTSGILTADQVRAELEAAPDILRRYGIEQVVACFGIGSKANIDELWKPHEIHISELLEFAQTGIDRGLFCPAESDLFVTVPDNSTELKFCHESDIHLDSTNDALIGEFAQRWKAQGFSGFHKVGKRWVPFGAA